MASCAAGPSTRRRASLPWRSGEVSDGWTCARWYSRRLWPPARAAGCRTGSCAGGGSAHAPSNAVTARKAALGRLTVRRPSLFLDADVVPDGAHALHFLRGGHRAARLVLRVDEAGELHHPAIGLHVDRRRGLGARVGGDRRLDLGGGGRIVGELPGAALLGAVGGAGGQAEDRGRARRDEKLALRSIHCLGSFFGCGSLAGWPSGTRTGSWSPGCMGSKGHLSFSCAMFTSGFPSRSPGARLRPW